MDCDWNSLEVKGIPCCSCIPPECDNDGNTICMPGIPGSSTERQK